MGAASEERERLTDAVTRIATERGFRGVGAEQVARGAGLSIADFHRHFDNVDQCLLAAFDRFLERMLEHIDESCAEVAEWPEKVRLTIEAAFEFLAEVEPVARVFAVETTFAGPAGLERTQASIERAALRLKHGRLLYPEAADLPDATERMLVAGVVAIATAHLLREDGGALAGAGSEAVEMLLAPYLGADRARSMAAA